jgi:uncharacterized protein (TIGR02453 family)
MSTSLSASTFTFLKNLKKNNNRDWFNANKHQYQAALDDFTAFVTSLIDGIGKFDKHVKGLDPKKTIFRIYRDTRFSKDKTPYKTHFAARLHKPNAMHIAGYYFSASPDEVYIAGGIYGAEPPHLNNIRKHISRDGKEFLKIMNNKAFKDAFGKLWEEDKLKTPPKGFDKEDPMIDYLKNKNFIVSHEVPKAISSGPKLLEHTLKVCKLAVPFHDFLNDA